MLLEDKQQFKFGVVMTGISMVFLVLLLVVKWHRQAQIGPNTKQNLQKQEKASRQSPRCKKTRKSPKSEENQHSIAARWLPSCHDGSCLFAKKSEEINLKKISHHSTMHHNAVRWSNLAPKLMKCTGSVIKLNWIFTSQHDGFIVVRCLAEAHYENYK